MTAFMLACFLLPVAIVWWQCRHHVFGSVPLFSRGKDEAVMALGTLLGLLMLVFPVAVGWLSCVIYRTGAEAWPFVVVTWTGVVAGGLIARTSDARRIIEIVDACKETNTSIALSIQQLGLGPDGRHDYKLTRDGPDYRPELHALWWLRRNDRMLPTVITEASAHHGDVFLCVGEHAVASLHPDGKVTFARPRVDVSEAVAAALYAYEQEIRRAEKLEEDDNG